VYFTDNGYDIAKKWLYIVIARNAGARSSTPALYVQVPGTPPSFTAPTLTVSAFQDTAVGDEAWKVSVSWNRAEGETYTLYRAPAEFASSFATTPESVGTFVQIPAASLSDKDGTIIYIDTVGTGALSLRQSYVYKVVAARDGSSAEQFGPLNSAPFSKFISGSPSVSTTGISYGQFRVTPYKPAYNADLSYEIFAAESDGTRLTSGWTQITGTPDENGAYIWTASDTRKRYVFSQTTKAGSLTLENSSASTSTSSPYAPKLLASSSSSGISPAIINQDANNVVLSIPGTTLTPPASPPANWWLQNSTYQNLYGAKIYRAAEANNSTIATTSVATIQFNATNAAITVNTASVPAWSFYIVLSKHHTISAATGSENWYFGVEYNNGYSASGFTNDNYYTINKSGSPAVITVSAVN
jgi:hypothetical protein